MAQAIYLETTAAGGVTWEEVEDAQLKEGPGGGSTAEPRKKLSIKIPKWCGKWVVSMDEYKDGVVGAKSKNLAGLTPARVQFSMPFLATAQQRTSSPGLFRAAFGSTDHSRGVGLR